ncbi:hypothetical protein [Yersinia sp. 2541 StPb PI]|uniref:hypothetical protein n=1 Tax=Yersinia sp. 2541 StPb PI TaxID=3117407 RepID=UPI003FA4B216
MTRNKVLKATVREKKKREPLLLAEANALFEQLQVRGDLDRYKSLVKYASMGNQSLGTVKAFFDSENGQAWLDTYPRAEAALGHHCHGTQLFRHYRPMAKHWPPVG